MPDDDENDAFRDGCAFYRELSEAQETISDFARETAVTIRRIREQHEAMRLPQEHYNARDEFCDCALRAERALQRASSALAAFSAKLSQMADQEI